jgi:hypothetical protein
MVAADGAAGDYFGYSVAIDGDTMVVGAYRDGDKGGTSGSAYIYIVATSGDTVVVGAYDDDDKGTSSGSAYIFARDVAGSLTAGWTQRAKLVAGDGAAVDLFGGSVAISRDTVAVGAQYDGDKGDRSGSAYIFTRDVAGSLTAGSTQRAKLVAGDGAAGDEFGVSMAIDGDTVAVGAYYDDDKGSDSGSAYIYTCDVAGSLTAGWTQRAKLVAGDGAAGDEFGISVAINGDTVAVGAYRDGDKGSFSGSAYIFTRDVAGSLTAGWTQRAKLVAEDGAAYDWFGYSVAISGDTVAVGAYYDDDSGGVRIRGGPRDDDESITPTTSEPASSSSSTSEPPSPLSSTSALPSSALSSSAPRHGIRSLAVLYRLRDDAPHDHRRPIVINAGYHGGLDQAHHGEPD